MRLREIEQFIDGASDAAFAVDGLGVIVDANDAAARLFGRSRKEIRGNLCCDIVRGVDDDGNPCNSDCVVQRAANKGQPLHNFDLKVVTPDGGQWFNVSVVVVRTVTASQPFTIHLLRPIDIQKRLEDLLRDFVVKKTNLSKAQAAAVVSSERVMARETSLTRREVQILNLVAKGGSSLSIASKLHISRTTVDNHLQHVLKKLGAHSRLEAVLRAEHSGLL